MKRKYKLLITILLAITIFMLSINIVPVKKVTENNPFIQNRTLIAAHRGGSVLNPDNTLKAFNQAVINYNVDILEMDLCMTKDNELVIIHDLYINDFCDVEQINNSNDLVYVKDLTYDELQNFNFGYKFQKNNSYPYKNLVTIDQENRKEVIKFNDLNLLKFSDLISKYYESYPDLMYIVEIKDEGELGKKAVDKLALILEEYPNLKDKIVVGTFHDEISSYLDLKYDYIMKGASPNEVVNFVLTKTLKISLFDKPTYHCLQIPTSYKVSFLNIKLDSKSLINLAHKKNIAVQYWTINNEDEMRKLINYNVDCIMTDNPKLLREVLNEYKK